MSKGTKKNHSKNAASKQTTKRHTTVPAAPSVATIARPEPAAEPSVAVPVVTAVVTPVEVAAAESVSVVVAEASIAATVAAPFDELRTAPVEATPVLDAQVVIGLIRDLRHEDADIAREAAVALGGTCSGAAVEALIEVLENTNGFYHSVVRSAAASSLAKLGDKRAVASLLCAVNDTMAEASAEAVRALADLGDARAVETLVGVVQNVTGFFQPVVRLAAVHALGRFDAPQAAAELEHVAADPNEDTVIRNAAGE